MNAAGRFVACVALLLVAAISLTLPLGCGSTKPCKKGTIFLTVKVGTIAADHVTVQVVTDGVAGTPSSLPLNGAHEGGVEITFPSGYVENKSVSVVVGLEKDGAAVGTPQTKSTRLAPGCTSLEVDFDRADGGRDLGGAQGGSGAGNDAGSGAGTGGSGTGGTGPGTGGSATGGSGTGGTATGGSATGTGGTATGGMGTAGMVGTGGRATGGSATGGRGTGGVAGTGGTATGGAAAGGAGGRACTPTATVENCYNNIDDDCNGQIDCADTAGCSPTSQCQALDPSMGVVGASVAATAACPTGATTMRTLNSGLMAAGCTGCSCGQGTATLTCSAQIYAYGTAADAMACAGNTGGTMVATLNSTQMCTTPNYGTPTGFVYGLRATMFAGTATGTCLPGGTPTKGTPTWGSTTKFCGVPAVGGGCATGQVCVPRPVVAAGACVLYDGARACPAGTRQSSWFTGFADTRACGACTCGGPTGGDCGSMLIGAGSDYSCPPSSVLGYIRTGDHLCLSTQAYSPGLQFSGSPQPPTCAANSAVSGSLATSGPQTLCCI